MTARRAEPTGGLRPLRRATARLRALLEAESPDAWPWAFTLVAWSAAVRRGLASDDAWAIDGLGVALRERTQAAGLAHPRLGSAPSDPLLAECLASLSAAAWLTAPGALAWVHQAWSAPEQDQAIRATRGRQGAKLEGRGLVLTTQLYSEAYMAEFLVRGVFDGWADPAIASAQTVDPACGGGHLLLAAFDACLAARLRLDPALTPAAAADAVLKHNLVGLDLDAEAVAVARTALWLRAWESAQDLPVTVWRSLEERVVAIAPLQGRPEDALATWLAVQPAERGRRAEWTALLRSWADAGELGALLGEPTDKPLAAEALAAHLGQPGLAVWGRLLAGSYDVVLANPPYLGLKFMGPVLKAHLAAHHPRAKRDLATAFLERCFTLCRPGGRLGFVTPRSWLYQAAFTAFREQLWETKSLLTFADLGSGAFDPALGLHAGVSVVLTCFANSAPAAGHRVSGVRAVGGAGPEAKARCLTHATAAQRYRFFQAELAALPGAPFVYDLPENVMSRLAAGGDLGGCVKQGLATTDNARFLRYEWEVPRPDKLARWVPCARGGTYQKWAGLDYARVNWQADGAAIKDLIPRKYPYLAGWSWVAKNAEFYFQPGLTYSYMCYGSLSARPLSQGVFEVASIGVFPAQAGLPEAVVLAALNARTGSWLLRALSQKHMFQAGMTERLPLPVLGAEGTDELTRLVDWAIAAKRHLLRHSLREGACEPTSLFVAPSDGLAAALRDAAWLHAVEGRIDRLVTDGYGLDAAGQAHLAERLGSATDSLRRLAWPGGMPWPSPDLPTLDPELADRLLADLPEQAVTPAGQADLLAQAAALLGLAEPEAPEAPAEEADAPGERLALPAETWLEAIARRLALHPLSACQLLEHGRLSLGWRRPAAERAWLEDALSARVLLLLGHQWPRQLARGEAPDPAAPEDGVWCLSPGASRDRLAEQVRAVFGPEVEIERLLGCTLGDWLADGFFAHHSRSFKRRPVVWQLASRPAKRDGEPAFSCLLYAHKLVPGSLATLGEAHVRPRLTGATPAEARELTALLDTLAAVEASGFATPELAAILDGEPLDRYAGPALTRQAWHAQEQAYAPDPHDGVRVNLAPLQRAGLLRTNVLSAVDVDQALADRAGWRGEERRACRSGLLPGVSWQG